MKTEKLIIECLRSAIFGKALDKKLFEDLSEKEYSELYIQAERHDVAHLVCLVLDGAGLLSASPISKQLTKQQMLAIYRYENLKYELDMIGKTFEEEVIPYIPLKGAVIREMYPEPWLRTSCDIDVLVPEEELDRAVDALSKKLGYVANEKRDYHDISLHSPNGMHLELHFSIKENIPELDGVLSRVWEYASPVSENRSLHKLSAEFLIFHLIAHTSYHFVGGGCGIKPFIDLLVLKNKLEFDENAVLELCRECGIEKFYFSALSLSNAWFSDGEINELMSKMEAFVFQGGVYGTLEAHVAARREVRGGKLGYFMSRVFAPYEMLKSRYPSMKSKALIPIYQVRRWCDVIKDGKLKKGMRELKLNREIDGDRVLSVQKLMRELELTDHIK